MHLKERCIRNNGGEISNSYYFVSKFENLSRLSSIVAIFKHGTSWFGL